MFKLRRNYPIAKLSTFQIGGRAGYFCEVKSFNDFLKAVETAKQSGVSYKIVAGGSNVVFPDGQLNHLLIKIKNLTYPAIKAIGTKIEADSGANLMRLIKKAVAGGLSGLETLSGIPGTVGGAIVGNAGAYGQSISGALERVLVWDPVQNKKLWLDKNECHFQYRHSIFKEQPYLILRAVFKFSAKGGSASGGNKERIVELKTISNNIIATRLKKYPAGLRCPGSFFKNVLVKEISAKSLKLINQEKIIEGKIPSGYLLEQIGAKGMRMGGIRIADFHGNLLINDGRARSEDVKKLSRILKNKVQKKFGINLEEEVRYF
ncbi:MAG: UDP-N-acetylmuramate dehydrogenase [bacterium]|nr:UDP-N-acetylmuramate dehydrogenase [bacterium]